MGCNQSKWKRYSFVSKAVHCTKYDAYRDICLMSRFFCAAVPIYLQSGSKCTKLPDCVSNIV